MSAALGLWLTVAAAALGLSISAVQIAVLLVFLLLLLERGQRRLWDLPEAGPLGRPWLAYAAAALLCALAGVDPERSLRFIPRDLQKIFAFYVFTAALAGRSRPKLAAWLAAGLSASALIGLYQVASQNGLAPMLSRPAWLAPFPRAHGTIHPVTFGETMVFLLCGALAFYARPDDRSGLPKPAAAAVMVLGLAALLLSSTRGAWTAMAAGGLVLFARAPRRLSPVLALGLALAAAAFALPGPLSSALRERAAHFSDPRYESNASRIELWKTALEMAKDRPILGVGLSNYYEEFARYHPATVEGKERWGSAHDTYLQQLAERGVVGLAALLWVLGALWWSAWSRERERSDAWSLWALSASTAFLVMNLTESSFQVSMTTTLFIFIWVVCRETQERPA